MEQGTSERGGWGSLARGVATLAAASLLRELTASFAGRDDKPAAGSASAAPAAPRREGDRDRPQGGPNGNDDENDHGGRVRDYLIVFGLAGAFLVWGFGLFAGLGKEWPPQWYYGSVQDVPGESPYSSARAKQFFGSGPATPTSRTVHVQHVMGRTPHPDVLPEEEDTE